MVSSSSSAALRAASWSSSMAPSTACSASLLHGAWRPAYSRSVEEAAGDTDVIPGRSRPVVVPQQGGWMIGNDDGSPAEPVHLVAQRREGLLRVEQGLRCRPSHGEDHLRLEEVELAVQVRQAGRDLVVLRLAVLGGPALHDVA